MTNEEYLEKKIKDTIDEEYQKYLKSLKVPTKEEWLKMEHKEENKHKFNVGDIIVSKKSKLRCLVRAICNDGTYELVDDDEEMSYMPVEYVDCNFVLYL